MKFSVQWKRGAFVLMIMQCLLCSPVEGKQERTPPLSDAATAQFSDDLTLSEAQRQILLDLVKEYQAAYEEASTQYSEGRRKWTIEHYINAKPELDESFDISHLPIEEQEEIKFARRVLKSKGTPGGILSTEQLHALNENVNQRGIASQKIKQELQDETLAKLRNLLAPQQLELWPMAMRRLEINIEDQNPKGRHSPDDPRDRVDMLAMIMQATEEDGGELHEFSDAMRTPDRILTFEKNNQDMIGLAETMLAFETSYHSALTTNRRQLRNSTYEFVMLMNSGESERAARFERKRLDIRQRIWNTRLRFVEDIAAQALQILGEEASLAWQHRFSMQFCPVLYQAESTDMLYQKIIALDGIEQESLTAMQEVYDQHCLWREQFKPRVMKLEIDERCAKLWSNPKDERGLSKRLQEAHQTRIDRAEQANRRLRALLPPEHQAAFDEWWNAWREEHSKYSYPPTINVRP